MAEEGVNLERILQVYRKESQRKTLTSLERDFWERVQRYVDGLDKDLQKESSKDPNSAKAALLRDELKKVVKRREQIYQYRERKIALMATSAISGGTPDIEPLTPVEEESFRALIEVLEKGRRRTLEGQEEQREEKPAPKPEPKARTENKRPLEGKSLVRILEDLPAFVGLDVTYDLKKEDVVTLPDEVAQLLIGKGKAEKIQPRL